MYIRFATQFINLYNENETGVFMALKYLREDYSLTTNDDVYKLKMLAGWFNEYLEKPDKFSKAKNKNPENISLSWFKDSAKDHLGKMEEIVEILERYDFVVERLISRNPGYIVYEDEYQVSAIPFKSDRGKVI